MASTSVQEYFSNKPTSIGDREEREDQERQEGNEGHDQHGTPTAVAPAAKGVDNATVTAHETSSQMTPETRHSHDDGNNATGGDGADGTMAAARDQRSQGWFAYLKTRDFYLLLLLGQVLALLLTTQNTMTTFLQNEGTSIPAFQSLFNYILLFLVYHLYTVWRIGGIRKYGLFLWKDGWKYFLLSFCDVEGNYFTVLAYRYTTLLSAQLINFWAIAVVLLVSFFLLRVRYHFMQIGGILVCIGGLGVLLASDHITGTNQFAASDAVKGDLFCLLGATFYGLSNVTQEFFLSKRPLYEVLGMMGLFGMLINGVQAAIFDRASFQSATWNPAVGGYLTGYTLALACFYSLGSIVFRMGSAVFFNISLLTANFWGVIIGVKVFKLHIHFMYPIAFVLIIIGQFIYFLGKKVWGDAFKPWLGPNQERGVLGIGTAKRRAELPNAIV